MDSQHGSADHASNEEIFGQLREYVDALAARAEHEGIATQEIGQQDRPTRRATMMAVAAAVAVLAGSAVWIGSREGSSSISSTSDDRPTTTESEAPDDSVLAQSWLMPDPAEWVVTEAYDPQAATGTAASGVWAWRIDGNVYLLVDEVGWSDLRPLDQARVEVGDGRVTIGWLDGDNHLGLQGYGVDEPTLRSVASSITATESGWTIPQAEALVAEAATDSGPSESIQVGYSPLKPDGTADLSTVVTSIRRQGTEGDMYRELFAASGAGQVDEVLIAGRSGFLISGPFTSYGLAFGDGTVFSWSTLAPDVDLAAMLKTVRAVSADEWDRAVADADRIVGEAVTATIADPDAGIDPDNPADDPELPRYLLPEPWTFTFVTDMGLWSAEERAQRAALEAANAPPGGFAELIWTQGFTASEPPDAEPGPLPFAVPDIVVQVYRRETDEPLNPEPGEGEPFSFAGLDGYIERVDMHDPQAAGGTRTEFRIFAAQGPLFLNIEAPFSTEDRVRLFAQSLTIPGEDVSRGVVSSADWARLILELPGDAGNGANYYGRWVAGYTTEPGNDQPQASLRVESMSFEQIQLELMRWRTRGLNYEPVPSTKYLADQYQRIQHAVFDDEGNPVLLDQPDVSTRTSLLRYDPDNELLVALDLADDLAATIGLIEQLTPTDIDTWRELVEPYNARPLEPR